MNFRSGARGGLRRRRNGVANGTIDLTPLIDVTFQLLIFFLLTASFRNESSFRLQLPKAQSREPVTEKKAVVIKISEDGRFQIDNKVVDMRELEMRLCNAQDEGVAATVNIKADRATKHENVVKAMDIARACGIKKMGILSKQ